MAKRENLDTELQLVYTTTLGELLLTDMIKNSSVINVITFT